MDIQLEELLQKIKQEGVAPAEQEAARIAADADASQKKIIAGAQKEAEEIVSRAKAEAAKFEEAGKASLKQASRDVFLSLKDRVGVMVAELVKEETKKAYGPEVLKDAIPAAVKALAGGADESNFEVLLPASVRDELEKHFHAAFADLLKAGVEIKPCSDIDAGFRVASRDGSAYYDFSAEAISELLARHLNDRLSEIVRSAAKDM